jgi:enoyl-CoA hydratase
MTLVTSSSPQAGDDQVLARVAGSLGRLTLNRSHALNALNVHMVRAINAALEEWRDRAEVTKIVIDGAGQRGLCAGGDLRAIHADLSKGGHATREFWAAEYRLDLAIRQYAKPVIAIMDGLVLGGGVGIAGHASHRVVTERSRIGMPEVLIGFCPDAGGTYLLGSAPGELGTHFGLTGAMMGAGDAVRAGFADHFVHSSDLDALVASLADTTPDDAIARVGASPPDGQLGTAGWLDEAYAGDDVGEILHRLDQLGTMQATPAATRAAAAIRAASPTAVRVALRSLRAARKERNLADTLVREYRVSNHWIDHPDFAEGIRAKVLDKDNTPRWTPATTEVVDDAVVASFFDSLGAAELNLEPLRLGATA